MLALIGGRLRITGVRAKPPEQAGAEEMREALDDADELLTVADVCAWFKVTKTWVYDEVEAGRLPYVRIGRQHLRFRRIELRQFIMDHSRRSLQRKPRSLKPATGALEPLD